MTLEEVAAIVRSTCLPKELAFELVNEWVPEVSDEELQQMWETRKGVIQ